MLFCTSVVCIHESAFEKELTLCVDALSCFCLLENAVQEGDT